MKKFLRTRVIVDLNDYAHNLSVINNYTPKNCGLMVVIKANAYGHGLAPIGRRALTEHVSMMGVATVEEGIQLRNAGIDAPILVMVQPSKESIASAIEYNLRLTVSDVTIAERIGEYAQRLNKVVAIHCKIDSGMGRQGFDSTSALSELLYIARISHLDIEGIATHFPTADIPNDAFTLNQIKTFKHLLKQLNKEGIPYEMAHAANSAAIVNYPSSHLDLVRSGLLTYGVWPVANASPSLPIKPVLRWETKIILIKKLSPGTSVGYGRTYITESGMRAALLPVGYGDGYPRSLSNKADVLIRGRRCPICGMINMDQMVVDISQAPEASVGDLVTLIGKDGKEQITVEELAQAAQTVPHDILASIGSRVTREYIE